MLEQVVQHSNAQYVAFHHGSRRLPEIAVAALLQNGSLAWRLKPPVPMLWRCGGWGRVVNVDDAAVVAAGALGHDRKTNARPCALSPV
jgi:hypothetical protein